MKLHPLTNDLFRSLLGALCLDVLSRERVKRDSSQQHLFLNLIIASLKDKIYILY